MLTCVNTRAERDSSSVKSHFSCIKQIKSALFLWTFTSYQSSQFHVICTMTALIHTGYMFLQHPSPETSFLTFLTSAFLLFVSWKHKWFPLYSRSLSECCFCSFYNYTPLCVYVKEVQVQAGLGQVQIFFSS